MIGTRETLDTLSSRRFGVQYLHRHLVLAAVAYVQLLTHAATPPPAAWQQTVDTDAAEYERLLAVNPGSVWFLTSVVNEHWDSWNQGVAEGSGTAYRLLAYHWDGRTGIQRDERRMFDMASKAAAAGDAPGMVLLADMYYNGIGGGPPDYAQCLAWLRKAAGLGQRSRAFSVLSYVFDNGMPGVDRNVELALAYRRKAAEAGLTADMVALGRQYLIGSGVEKDPAKAAEWLRKAGALGNGNAWATLGRMYEEGTALPKDPSEAAKCYDQVFKIDLAECDRLHSVNYIPDGYIKYVSRDEDRVLAWRRADAAASLGATWLLGICAQFGSGMNKDLQVAQSHFKKTADSGMVGAMLSLARFYREEKALDEDGRKAFEWYRKAALAGDREGLFIAGYLLESGQGTSRNAVDAKSMYEQAASKGSARAMFRLGLVYEEGAGIPKDRTQAEIWFTKAAEAGLIPAMVRLGVGQGGWKKSDKWCEQGAARGGTLTMLELGKRFLEGNVHGYVGPERKESALKWFQRAAEAGDANGHTMVGAHYEQLGDYAAAEKAYRLAAELGSAEAAVAMARWFRFGNSAFGVDTERAIEWYRKAAERGDVRAMFELGEIYSQKKAK